MRQRPLAGSVLLEFRHGEMDTDARVLRGLHARTHKSANIRAAERTARTQSAHEESFVNQSGNKRRESSIVSRGLFTLHKRPRLAFFCAKFGIYKSVGETADTRLLFFFCGGAVVETLCESSSDPL